MQKAALNGAAPAGSASVVWCLWAVVFCLDQFHDRHLGAVTTTGAELDDTEIASWPVFVSWGDVIEQLRHCVVVLDLLEDRPTSMKIATASLCDDLLGVRAKDLRLCMRGGHLLMLDQGHRQVRQDLLLMRWATAETLSPLWPWHQTTLVSTSA